MNIHKAISGKWIIAIAVVAAVLFWLVTGRYIGVGFVIVAGIAASIVDGERKKHIKAHPELYPEEVQRQDSHPTKNIWKWLGIISLGFLGIIVAFVLFGAYFNAQGNTSTRNASNSTSNLLNGIDDHDHNVTKLSAYLGNDVESDPSNINQNYVAAKCMKFGNIVTQLNQAADKGMINLDSDNLPFVAKMMKSQDLLTATDYVYASGIFENMQTILLAQGDSSSIGTQFAFNCAYMGGYGKAYKIVHQDDSTPSSAVSTGM